MQVPAAVKPPVTREERITELVRPRHAAPMLYRAGLPPHAWQMRRSEACSCQRARPQSWAPPSPAQSPGSWTCPRQVSPLRGRCAHCAHDCCSQPTCAHADLRQARAHRGCAGRVPAQVALRLWQEAAEPAALLHHRWAARPFAAHRLYLIRCCSPRARLPRRPQQHQWHFPEPGQVETAAAG